MSSKVRSSRGGFSEFARAVARRRSDRGLAEGGLVVFERVPSTHLLGRRIASEYSREHATPPKTDLLAWEQTAGRGRGVRSWSSPPGGVYATLIRPLSTGAVRARGARAKRLQSLPLLVAAALCEALNADLGGRCRLKWPNDLLVGGRKLGGVLIDAASRGAAVAAAPGEPGDLAVISFGVNHGPGVEEPGTTSLEREAPGRTHLAEIVDRLVAAVDEALARSLSVEEVIGRYRRLSLHRPGDALRCRLRDAEVEGIFQGFDRYGFLRLLVGGEEKRLTAGEIADHG